ncbi:MAG: M67 family metallopeptidase [Deltaproteobacteria bacterium]|jgi:proteasome lid subunit RPN8/RPN11|nr:M67 family metallopeptidase [Deltaproteobacteria bacterium]
MDIPFKALLAIRQHGEDSYPAEACGFVFGHLDPTGKVIGQEIYQAENVREPERRGRRFQIEPEEFLAAELKAQSLGLDLLAIYHSHPDHPAQPSANDLEKALPFYRYLIVAVDKAKAKDTTAWVLAPDRSQFLAEELNVTV